MKDNIIITPLYSEDNSLVCFIVEKEDRTELTEQDVADALRGYADVIECEFRDKEGMN